MLLGGAKKIGFDRIRQKVEVSERKDNYSYLGEVYEMMRKNNTLPEDFGRVHSRNYLRDIDGDKSKTERKIIECVHISDVFGG